MSQWNSYFWPIAAKQHRCEWCGEAILIGEKHAHFVGEFEGEFQNWRMHEECQKDWEFMPDTYREDGFSPFDNVRPRAVLPEQVEPK